MTSVILRQRTVEKLETKIVRILIAHGESFINDDGVDKEVCENVSKEIACLVMFTLHDLNLFIVETRD